MIIINKNVKTKSTKILKYLRIKSVCVCVCACPTPWQMGCSQVLWETSLMRTPLFLLLPLTNSSITIDFNFIISQCFLIHCQEKFGFTIIWNACALPQSPNHFPFKFFKIYHYSVCKCMYVFLCVSVSTSVC